MVGLVGLFSERSSSRGACYASLLIDRYESACCGNVYGQQWWRSNLEAVQWGEKSAIDVTYCRCAEAGVVFLDSKAERILEVDERLSSVQCNGGRAIKSRYRLVVFHCLGLVSKH